MKPTHFPTAVTIANAVELVTGAAHELSPDLAKTLGVAEMSRTALADLVISRLTNRMTRFISTNKAGAK
jgi:hypothetical protein